MKGFDYSKITEGKFYDKMRPVGVALEKMLYKIEYIGTENIPENGGFILASNHVNALDPVGIALGMKNRQLHFMGKKELFENPITKFFLSKLFKPAKAKSGVAVIAKAAKADVLPVAIYTSDEMKKGTKLTIRFGEVIPYESLGINDDSSREEIKACAQNIMGEITKLWEMGHCE